MMKKFCRIASLTLVLALALSTVAFAAENSKATVTVVEGMGATAEFDTSNEEIVNVSVTSNSLVDGSQYLVLMVKSTDDGENYTIGQDSILYIDQTVAVDNTVSFAVYPSTYTDSVILITGAEDGALKVAIVEGKYVLGDVNDDGYINTRDALLILQHVAGVNKLTDAQMLPANTNGDTFVNTRDALLILQLVAGIISEL